MPEKYLDLTGLGHFLEKLNARYVRHDTNSQGLTSTQKSNARTNIGAGTSNLTLGTTDTTAAAGNHLYHYWTNNQYYSDSYSGEKNWRMMTENVLADTLRWKAGTIANKEYYNYDNSTWTASTLDFSNLFNGNYSDGINIPYAQRKFRFTITSSSGWPTTTMLCLEGSWYNAGTISKVGGTDAYVVVTVETRASSSDDWATKVTANFPNNCMNKQGLCVPSSALHTGHTLYRITVELGAWTNTSNSASLKRLMILSNYGGSTLTPFSYNGSGKVTAMNTLNATTLQEGGTNLSSKYVPQTRTINSKALSSDISLTHADIGAGNLTLGDGVNYMLYRTHESYRAGYYYHTTGDESVVFANKYNRAGWIFAVTDPTNRTNWQSLTPTLQIKNSGVAINKLIGQGVTPSYALDVNGSANATSIYENGTDISTKYYLASNPNGYTANTGTVIGSGLTADYFTLGNGTVNIKISTMKPTTSSTTWSATSDVNVPTMKAISNYVTGLGYITSSSLSNYVPTSRTINNKALTSDIMLSASDVQALPSTTNYVKSASVSGNTLTLTTTGLPVTFTPTFTDTNYYQEPTFSSGLLISQAVGGSLDDLCVPYASSSQAGVVTTSDQTFAGTKTFASGSINIGVDGWKATLQSSSSVMNKNHTYTFPDANGTLALTDDIPTIPTYYEHNIRVYYSTGNFSVTFKFIDTNSAAYTYSTLTKALYDRGFASSTTVCSANGVYGTSSAQNLILGVYGYNSSSAYRLYFRYLPLVSYSSSTATINNTVSGETTTYLTLTSSYTIQDKVRTL